MSINSLLSNTTILDELALLIQSKIPEGEAGISSLINTDNNVIDGVVGIIGNIDLEQNINITTATINELTTPNIQALNNVLNITQGIVPQTTIDFNSGNLNFSVGASDIALTNTDELLFADISLKTNSMNNPFSLDGANNQLLQTDGSKNLSWVSQGGSLGYEKYYANYIYNQPPAIGNELLVIFNQTLTGTTAGQTLLIDANFTFYVDFYGIMAMSVVIDGLSYDIFSYVDIANENVHIYRGFTHSSLLTSNDVNLTIKLTGVFNFSVDASDYMNVLVSTKD